jgi:hypothetical protein
MQRREQKEMKLAINENRKKETRKRSWRPGREEIRLKKRS